MANANAPSPKDPRFRSFRTATYSVYLVIVVTFSLLIVYSVFRSVNAMSPRRTGSSDVVLTVRECVDALDLMWRKLEIRRQQFTRTHPAENVDEDFSRFRVEWLHELRQYEEQCAVDSASREKLRAAFHQLENVQDLYTTHAVQYAGEVGPAVDKLDAALKDVRASLNASK